MRIFTPKLMTIAIAVLWTAVLLSAAGAIYSKHRARELFVTLERLNRQRDTLEIELQLSPLDLQRVALAIQPLQRHEQLARTMFRVDRARGREQHRCPEHGNRDRHELRSEDAHAVTSRAPRLGAWRCA